MTKRERLLRHIESDQLGDYIPAAFFLHFGSDFHNGSAAITKHRGFFEFTDMDFVKIQFELDFPHLDIPSDLDFEGIPFLPLDFYESQLAVVKGVVDALKSEALVVLTLYSPFMILGKMVGQDVLDAHLERDPKHVFKSLETVTNSLLQFVEACAKLGLDGFYHSTQGGENRRFSNPEVFSKWIKPTDHRVMNEIDEMFAFNILHVCDYQQSFGVYDDLTPFLDYPGSVVNVSTQIGDRHWSPSEVSNLFGRPFMGGMQRLGPLSTGSAAEARLAAREVLAEATPRFILGADCTVAANAPWENLRAAIDEAHRFRR